MSAAAPVRLAHVSDPHLTSLEDVSPAELCNKRILGYLSWRLRRHREHRPEVLDMLMADLSARAPDHVIVTGDLTHVGTPRECATAGHWLKRIAARHPLTLVPGNHDRYISAPWAETIGLWNDYMRGDGLQVAEFPATRRLGAVVIIGLSTAVPSPPFCATGTLGKVQLSALRGALLDHGKEGLFRVVVLHHPPAPHPHDWRRSLTDAVALQAVLAEAGAELVLHGHSHCWLESRVPGPAFPIHALGTPSASALTQRPGRRAGYGIVSISECTPGWEVLVERFALAADAEGMTPLPPLRYHLAGVNVPC